MSEQLDFDGSEEQDDQKIEISAEELAALRQAKDELESKLHREELERAKLEERLNAAKPGEEKKETPRLTREQLQAAVDNGEITEAQMQTELARQMREDIRKEVTTEMEQKLTAAEQKRTIQQQFDQYVDRFPDIKKDGTPDNKRVIEEITDLTRLGYTWDMRTEVLAMRNVFGPLNRVRETTRERRETHRETGGVSPPEEPKSGAAWEKGLTASQVRSLRTDLDKGNFKGEDDKLFLGVVTRMRTQNKSRSAA